MDNAIAQLAADFSGVPAEQLRDAALLSGLLIAAANAAGFSPVGVPTVRTHAGDGVSAMLLMAGSHLTLHAFPKGETLLLDVVGPASHDFRKAVDVFARRLSARDIKSDIRGRG